MSEPELSLSDLDNAPTELPAVVAPPGADDYGTLLKRHNAVVSELETVSQEFNAYKRRVRGSEILDTLIEPYAKKIFWFMVWYCLFVGVTLLANAGGLFVNDIDSGVMSFLVGSTATTVLGLVGMVVTGIFNGVRKGSD